MNFKKILIFGAGAVGGSVGGWLASKHAETYFFDSPQVMDSIKRGGIQLYEHGKKDKKERIPVKTISSLGQLQDPDMIFLAVKNYSLDAVSKLLKEAYGDKPIILGLQNGIENQKILPKYFSKVVYAVVSYNAWLDDPQGHERVIGYQKKGPIVIGTPKNDLRKEIMDVYEVLSLGIETIVSSNFQDAAHCKMVVNLTNSFTTLVGHQFQEISDPDLFQKLLTNLTYEGVQILKKSGYHEVRFGGMPSWTLMKAAAKLPVCLIRPIFKKNIRKMVMSSMAQDILQRKGTENELESLNGYFIRLANAQNMQVPYNRAIYELCKKSFSQPDFHPIDVKEVFEKVIDHLGQKQ